MTSKIVLTATLLLTLAVNTAVAQTTRAGDLFSQGGGVVPVAPFTFIDTANPVTADGTMTTLVTRWLTDADCSDEVKVRFFRPNTSGLLGDMTLVGTAGPFAAVNGFNRFTFSGIAVKAGDLLAITQLKSGCGGVTWNDSSRPGNAVYMVGGDYNGGALKNFTIQVYPRSALAAIASDSANHLVGTIPVAGSAAGAFGSFFRTAMSVTNASAYPADITIVYHPAGAAPAASDPSLLFTLPPFSTRSSNDVVALMSQSGLGSIDVLSSAYEPSVTTRVFNDGGTAGTSGFTEELVTAGDRYQSGDFAAIQIPPDLTNYRVNIGVRTFDKPVTVTVVKFDANGTALGSNQSHTYPANYFEQVPLATFLGTTTPPAGGMMNVYLTSGGGSAVFYTATTDNRTNDGSLKMITSR